MLKRHIYQKLVRWKETNTQQGLLLAGARQAGKTTIIREFGKSNYQRFAEINFLENKAALDSVAAARDAKDLLTRMSALSQTEFIPDRTLVFFDEVQACQDVLTWVKFLKETAPHIDFIFSGSLLGIDLFNVRSVPVGFLQTLQMYPLTFLEFCEANGAVSEALATVRECFSQLKPVPDYLHEYLTDLYYKYLLVGGMPDAVQSFVDIGDVTRVRNVQEGIVQTYGMDITKYVESPVERRHIKTIYEAIPNQLNKENKRFKFTKLGENTRFSHLATAFDWLESAGIALSAMRVQDPQYPLGFAADTGSFKLYMNDVGLLTSCLMRDFDIEILNHRSSMNFGSIFENAVEEELVAQGFETYYYNTKGTGEVDFLVQNRMGEVVLIEVKSGKDYKRHRAFSKLLSAENYRFAKALVFHDGNVKQEGKVTYLPVYMAGLLSPDAAF